MRFFPRSAQNDLAEDDDVIQRGPHDDAVRIKWELDQTPEALYARINDISTLFSRGKYTKGLAVQRLLDLLYDINQSDNPVYGAQAKSRYYLLIFNYIFRIRTPRVRLTNVMKRRLIATDQMMYIQGVDFSTMSLPGLRIGNALFKDCNFSGSILRGLQAANCHFEECSFRNANLNDFSGNSCHFIHCGFDSANLSNSEFSGSSFEGVSLASSNLSSSRIVKSSFVGCDFSEIVSSRGQFPLRVNGCSFLACSFRDADLRSADFRNTRMTGCDTLDAKKDNAKGLA